MLPTRLSRKSLSYKDNCGLTIQSEYKVIENNLDNNKKNQEYNYPYANLI